MSDVYVYADCYGGWTTHIAGNRFAFRPLMPFPIPFPKGWHGTWNNATRTVSYPTKWRKRAASVYFAVFGAWEWVRQLTLDHIPKRRIELPHASSRFNDATPKECADRLLELRAIGYNVPQYAIDSLLQEELEIINAP